MTYTYNEATRTIRILEQQEKASGRLEKHERLALDDARTVVASQPLHAFVDEICKALRLDVAAEWLSRRLTR